MRIIGGYLKGKTIKPPSGFRARPTTDFAKEGLFNVLENEFDFAACRVLDLFSGTGSISYEFASRGVSEIYSVEMNPLNACFIRKSIILLKIKGMQVVRHNVFDFIDICKLDFDIIFADPPYALEGLDTIPDRIFAKGENGAGTPILKEEGVLILEHSAEYSFNNHPKFFKEKKYGNVHFTFFR